MNQFAMMSIEDLRKLVIEMQNTRPANDNPVGAFKAAQAARYLGVSLRSFYYLLKSDPDLAQACFSFGTARLWPRVRLDAWMERQVAKGQPKIEAA